ncbi:hypothetical protein U3653_04295 [Nocardia sp. CDC186]|uniref:Uncharacterized protein n=1 Tax=Nocardia implantans TaxID=3108168 RepID=A0ABU6AP52_9NOCA|nr:MULTISPECIES: hypothetical protein [unclassified Nocardia]MBF6189582.1 hypothetical protein [Nocardia beijingensis]MEA3527190.1 hypothetical protein [Nocardia sp. CDC192]MEB3509232.1 hypothetical protein [Nocardia sp. CDC186]
MSPVKLFRTVIVATTVFLAVFFLLGAKPAEPSAWVWFAITGVVFALLFAVGLRLVTRLDQRRR